MKSEPSKGYPLHVSFNVRMRLATHWRKAVESGKEETLASDRSDRRESRVGEATLSRVPACYFEQMDRHTLIWQHQAKEARCVYVHAGERSLSKYCSHR